MKLCYLIIVLSTISCIQVPHLITEETSGSNEAQNQNQTSQNREPEGEDFFEDYNNPIEVEVVEDGEGSIQNYCEEDSKQVTAGRYLWQGEERNIEIFGSADVVAISGVSGNAVVHSGARFTGGWQLGLQGQLWLLKNAWLRAPKNMEVYTDYDTDIDLNNGENVIIYTPTTKNIRGLENCRNCRAVPYRFDPGRINCH